MPIYEYQCSKCGKRYGVLQSWGDPEEKKCEFCRGKVRKLVSPSAFHLKGSSWYSTDYATKAKGGNLAKTANEVPSTDATETEAKPDKKDDQQHNNAA